jgi:hypothetical protein
MWLEISLRVRTRRGIRFVETGLSRTTLGFESHMLKPV